MQIEGIETAREGPVRFAVLRADGCSSNSWRLWTSRRGDVYLACRDNFGNAKVSLHASGRWRMAFTTEAVQADPSLLPPGQDRTWEVWQAPADTGDAVALHQAARLMLFTPELVVAPAARTTKRWKSTTFLPAPRDPALMAVVTVAIAHRGPRVEFDQAGWAVVAALPVGPDREAMLVLTHEPMGDRRDGIVRVSAAIRAEAERAGLVVPDDGYNYVYGKHGDGVRFIAPCRA